MMQVILHKSFNNKKLDGKFASEAEKKLSYT